MGLRTLPRRARRLGLAKPLLLLRLALVIHAPAALPAAAPVAEQTLRVALAAQDAPCIPNAQLLGDLDRPVGDAIKLQSLTMPARLDAKGQLELDVRGDGRFRTIGRQDMISVTLKGEGDKPKTLSVKLLVFKRDNGTWCYRNVTQLLLRIEAEQFSVVDANGNGLYNEAGVDGLAWQGQTWFFPLPDKAERWCSPTYEFSGLQFGPFGETPAVQGRLLATTAMSALPVLKGINDERVKLGLTPRPEDVKLSADLRKHCLYMSQNNTLTHDEDKSKPGYTPEGAASGPRSILGMGTPATHLAARMVQTYFHRQDVVRPNTSAFGVGYEGRYGGIDGRTNCGTAPPRFWPVLCPVPGQTDVPLTYCKEAPDATPGDDAAGYPLTAYLGSNKLKLASHSLKVAGPSAGPGGLPRAPAKAASQPGEAVECYVYDPQTGPHSGFTSFQQCVCIIPKEPLAPSTEYEVALSVDVEGRPWARTWRFSTAAGGGGGRKPPARR